MSYCSIIIPTFNRFELLEKTLNSIQQFRQTERFEVIVVDNGSSDDTDKVCARNWPFLLKYFYDDIPGSLTGRHRGFQESKGDILCFIDDDIILNPGWIDAVIYTMENRPDIDLLTGPVFGAFESEPPKWLEHFWYEIKGVGKFCSYLSLLDLGEAVKEIDPELVWSLNFCIRRFAFQNLKGFHPDYVPETVLQGDGETGLAKKAVAAGMKAMYHPGLEIAHFVSKDRLTKEYFGNRAYFQGICDSFTSLRENGPPSFLGKLLLDLRDKFSAGKKELLHESSGRDILLFARQRYKEGYHFHQDSFRKSRSLRNWVLKDDYLDYRLPSI
jgi:glycosyltransferase involved in cell wall biosynthesis